jgi:RNA polymerase sigma-70 factor (ECF subfamily)
LVSRYTQPVFNLVLRLVSDRADAPDVVQEVFLKVFRNVGKFRRESSLKTWIYRIAVNESYNHRRWFGRRQGHEVGLEDEQGDGLTLKQVLADAGQSPFELASGAEAKERIEEALAHLKPAYRTVVVLRDVEGLTYEEIAEVLELNLGTVKSRIVRGRDALREMLTDRHFGQLQFAPQIADGM